MTDGIRVLLKPEYRNYAFRTMLELYDVENFRQLADKLGVSPSCIKKWKRGINYVPAEIFQDVLRPYMIKDKGISIFSKSTDLIKNIEFYLKKSGFEPHVYKSNKVVIYGWPMVLLWIEKIGTNNPKHQIRVRKAKQRARSLAWIAQQLPR